MHVGPVVQSQRTDEQFNDNHICSAALPLCSPLINGTEFASLELELTRCFCLPHRSRLPGRLVQPVIHHGPGGLRPRVALHRRRRGHVHPGLRRLHRRPQREHLPAQICKPSPNSPRKATPPDTPTPIQVPRFTPGLKIQQATSSCEGVKTWQAVARRDTPVSFYTKACFIHINEIVFVLNDTQREAN